MPSATAPATRPSPLPANATIFLIRHAEKPASGPGLSPAGQARAEAYVKYFQNLKDPQGKILQWDYLFACRDSDNSDRPLLTITPLAAALKKPIDTKYKDKDYSKLVADLQQKAKQYAGSKILICWHHGEILQLTEAMGASCATLPAASNWPSKWLGEVFGWLLQIYYKADGTIHHSSTQAINEKLMPDDTVDPVACK
jgi:hypothetical protein